jgi:SSS family solute:Na+ symporter
MSAGAWVGIVVVYFLAHRVRRIAEYTVPDILEKRDNKWARIFGTLAVIIAYVSIAGYQFRGGGRLLNIISSGGISPTQGAMITCGVIILFTLLAGMVSIVSIDVFNGIVMILSVVLAVPFALSAAGGWSGVAEAIPADHFAAFGSRDWIWAVGVFFPTFFLLLGESSIYQKFFSAESERAARRAVIGMIIGVVVIETLLCAVSVIGSAIHWNDPAFVDAAATSASAALVHDAPTTETIILQVAFENLPVIIGALLLAGGVAIILSTGNTFLMVPATNLTRDIYQRFIKPDADDRTIILFQRVSIAALGIVAFLLATQFTTILAMAFTAYTMVGAGITPALLAAFLWRRTTTAGGVASIVAGMGVTVLITIINWFHQRAQGEPFLETDYIIIPAATASILALVLVSLATAKPPREKWQPFYATPDQSPTA